MLIRRPGLDELDRVRDLVQAVVDEVYGGVWAQPPLNIGNDDWSLGWIACVEAVLAGVALTHDDWLDDL